MREDLGLLLTHLDDEIRHQHALSIRHDLEQRWGVRLQETNLARSKQHRLLVLRFRSPKGGSLCITCGLPLVDTNEPSQVEFVVHGPEGTSLAQRVAAIGLAHMAMVSADESNRVAAGGQLLLEEKAGNHHHYLMLSMGPTESPLGSCTLLALVPVAQWEYRAVQEGRSAKEVLSVTTPLLASWPSCLRERWRNVSSDGR